MTTTNNMAHAQSFVTPVPNVSSRGYVHPLLAAAIFSLFGGMAHAQNNSTLLKDDDLEKQCKAVMADVKKSEDIEKAAKKYDISKGDAVDLMRKPVEYVIKTLFKNIFVDHMQFKTKLVNGLNKNNTVEYILLKEKDMVQTNADAMAVNTIEFETTVKISDIMAYPVDVLDQHNPYVGDKLIQSQVKIIEDAFKNAMAKAENILSTGSVIIIYPSEAIYKNRQENFPEELKDANYVTPKPSKKGDGKYELHIDLNQKISTELADNAFVDKTTYTNAIIKEIMFMAIVDALSEQYKILIDEYAKDATKQNVSGSQSK